MASLNQIAAGIQKAERKGNLTAAKELTAIYNREYARIYSTPKEEEEDAGFFENVGTGLASGFVGTLESAALGAAARRIFISWALVMALLAMAADGAGAMMFSFWLLLLLIMWFALGL